MRKIFGINFTSANNFFKPALISAILLTATSASHAGVIVGGSSLITPAYLTQLENFLGEGELTLTNIFTKFDGATALDFHAAVDSKGRTFSVMHGTEESGISAIVGGYNPQSWSSSNTYNTTPLDADRTAFLFNLSAAKKFPQAKTTEAPYEGEFQTHNFQFYGPTFGNFNDLWVGFDLSSGESYGHSYVTTPHGRSIIDNSLFNGVSVQFGAFEVFTIGSFEDPEPTPEPATLPLLGASLLAFSIIHRRRAVTSA